MHRQAANDEGITSPFAQLFIMGAFVHELALGCQHVVGPHLLDMDERPLSSAEREVLDAGQREELILVVHRYTILRTVTPSGTAPSSTVISS